MNVWEWGIVFILELFLLKTVIVFWEIVTDLLENAIIIVYEFTHLFFDFLMNQSIQ